MKNKIYNFLFLIIFIIIFSIFYSGEYINFHKEKQNILNQKTELKNQINSFSYDKINDLNNTNFLYGPEENVLEILIEKINNAQNKIYVEIYMLTETRIQNAIKKAKEKNIEIKLILEKKPYMATNINSKAYEFLIKNNIEVVWSNTKNYSLNHSKLLLIDNQAIISTGNFTYSSFKYNREFFIITTDENIVSNLYTIFENDYIGNLEILYNDNLILSPNYSRDKIEYIINNAKNKIDMYFPYIQDKNLEQLLINKVKSGLQINLIVDKKIKEDDTYLNLINSGIKIKKLTKNKLHAKAILVDNKYLYIGSINFSTYSFDKNREIGILIKNEDIIKKFIKIFEQDLNL